MKNRSAKDIQSLTYTVSIDGGEAVFGSLLYQIRASNEPLLYDSDRDADTIASETAKALAPYYDVTLIYSFEKKGVLSNPDDDDSVIPVITHTDFEKYKADGTVAGGMIPKLENSSATETISLLSVERF